MQGEPATLVVVSRRLEGGRAGGVGRRAPRRGEALGGVERRAFTWGCTLVTPSIGLGQIISLRSFSSRSGPSVSAPSILVGQYDLAERALARLK